MEIVFGERKILFNNGESKHEANKFSLDAVTGNDNMNFLVVTDDKQDECKLIKYDNDLLLRKPVDVKQKDENFEEKIIIENHAYSYGIKGNFNKVEPSSLQNVIKWCLSAYELIFADQTDPVESINDFITNANKLANALSQVAQ